MRIGGVRVCQPITASFSFDYHGSVLTFEAQAVSDFSEFEAICVKPVPPIRNFPDGRKEHAYDDATYVAAMGKWIALRSDWVFLKSLSATTDLVWDSVDMQVPETWGKWRDDIIASGLPNCIGGRLVDIVEEANLLNEDKLREARRRFLAMRSGRVDPKHSHPAGQ